MPINQDTYRHIHLTSEQIVTYLTRQYTDEENHEIEQHLLNCGMCQDAMDGYETMNAREINMDLVYIQQKLDSRLDRSGISWKPFAIAASVSVLLVSVFFAYQFFQLTIEGETVALKTEKELDESTFTPDSLSKSFEVQGQSFVGLSDPVSKPSKVEKSEIKPKEIPSKEQSVPLEVLTDDRQIKHAVAVDQVIAEQSLSDDFEQESLANESPVKREEPILELADESSEEEFAEVVMMDEEVLTDNYRNNLKATSAVTRSSSVETDLAGDALDVNKEDVSNARTAKKRLETTDAEVRIDPEPTIGMEDYTRLLQNNLVYPPFAIENQISGVVVLSFTVTITGQIKNTRVVKGLGHGCDEEAVRLVKELGNWKPGSVNAIPEEMKVSVTVVFKLPN